MKDLHPNLANTTRESLKTNNGMNPAGYKELLHVMKHVVDVKDIKHKNELTRNSNKTLENICFSNRDYVGDPVNRRSISGFILYVLGVLVSWC